MPIWSLQPGRLPCRGGDAAVYISPSDDDGHSAPRSLTDAISPADEIEPRPVYSKPVLAGERFA